jgi:hypothetical protein
MGKAAYCSDGAVLIRQVALRGHIALDEARYNRAGVGTHAEKTEAQRVEKCVFSGSPLPATEKLVARLRYRVGW